MKKFRRVKKFISFVVTTALLLTNLCIVAPAESSSYTLGDVNGDGIVNLSDSVILFHYPNKIVSNLAADYDCNKRINDDDGCLIMRDIAEDVSEYDTEYINTPVEDIVNGFYLTNMSVEDETLTLDLYSRNRDCIDVISYSLLIYCTDGLDYDGAEGYEEGKAVEGTDPRSSENVFKNVWTGIPGEPLPEEDSLRLKLFFTITDPSNAAVYLGLDDKYLPVDSDGNELSSDSFLFCGYELTEEDINNGNEEETGGETDNTPDDDNEGEAGGETDNTTGDNNEGENGGEISYTLGDVNNDGKLDNKDAVLMLKYVAAYPMSETFIEEAMDVNGDGQNNLLDISMLLKFLAGWNVNIGSQSSETKPLEEYTNTPLENIVNGFYFSDISYDGDCLTVSLYSKNTDDLEVSSYSLIIDYTEGLTLENVKTYPVGNEMFVCSQYLSDVPYKIVCAGIKNTVPSDDTLQATLTFRVTNKYNATINMGFDEKNPPIDLDCNEIPFDSFSFAGGDLLNEYEIEESGFYLNYVSLEDNILTVDMHSYDGKNLGIGSFDVALNYDSSAMSLVRSEFLYYEGLHKFGETLYVNPYPFVWTDIDGLPQDDTVVARFTFRIDPESVSSRCIILDINSINDLNGNDLSGDISACDVLNVSNGVSGITMKNLPIDLEYPQGEDTINTDGGVVTVSYEDGHEEYIALRACNVSGFNSTDIGECTVTVEYMGKTTTFNVNVTERESENIIPGDVDNNGEVSIVDASLILKHIALWNVKINTDAADVTADGFISISDVILILKYIAKWDVVLR